jgi:hypothetical protein
VVIQDATIFLDCCDWNSENFQFFLVLLRDV